MLCPHTPLSLLFQGKLCFFVDAACIVIVQSAPNLYVSAQIAKNLANLLPKVWPEFAIPSRRLECRPKEASLERNF